MKRRSFLIFSLPLSLAGCGFHLRGLSGADENLPAIYLAFEGNPDNIAIDGMRRAFRNSKLKIVEESQTPWKMVVTNFFNSRIQTAIGGSDGNTREFEIRDGYTISVFKNDELQGSIVISNRTGVQYNSYEYIGDSEEEVGSHRRLAEQNGYASIRYYATRVRDAK